MKRTVLLTSLCLGAIMGQAQYQLDAAFGVNGIVSTDFTLGLADAYEIELLADGKFLVGGFDYGTGGEASLKSSFAMAKYNEDGSLDNSFNSTGKTIVNFPNISFSYGKSFDVLQDGKIIIGGTVYVSGAEGYEWGIAKLNADGTIDNTFGTSGKVVTNISFLNEELNGLAVAADGTIYAVGYTQSEMIEDREILVMAFNADGTLKTTFADNGKLMLSISTANDVATCIKLQDDGKLVVGGYSDNVTEADWLLIRINTDGTLDNTFGTNGIVSQSAYNGILNALDIQSDGKIVVAVTGSNPASVALAARFNADGSLQGTFGYPIDNPNPGYLPITVIGASTRATSVTVGEDGLIVIGGAVKYTDEPWKAMVVRLNPNGTFNTQFNSGSGMIIQQTSSFNNDMRDVEIQESGKILIAGRGNTNEGSSQAHFSIARFMEGAPTTGLSEVNETSLSAFPNPAIDALVIKVSEPTIISIYNVNGAMLETLELTNQFNLNISSFSPGMYFIRTAEGQTVKFIKE